MDQVKIGEVDMDWLRLVQIGSFGGTKIGSGLVQDGQICQVLA